MKSTAVTLDTNAQIAEANELIERQIEIGTTLLARAFAYERSRETPVDQKSCGKHHKAIKVIYNMDAEKALIVLSRYIRAEHIAKIAGAIALITGIMTTVLFYSVSVGYKVGLIFLTGVTFMLALVAIFEFLLEWRKQSSYTIKLAKGWLKAKKVFAKHNLLLAVGKNVLTTTNPILPADIERRVRLVTGDIPNLTVELFGRIKNPIWDRVLELALRHKKAQAQADIEKERSSRDSISEVMAVAQKVIYVDSAVVIREAFKKAEKIMEENVLQPNPKDK